MANLDGQQVPENRYRVGGLYKHSFIMQVVGQVEEGLDFKEAYTQYGLRGETLRRWLDKYASPSYDKPKRTSLSAVQRRSICRAIAQGKLTAPQAASTYHVHINTVYLWQKKEKYELEPSNDLLLKKSRKASAIRAPNDEVKRLQQELADATLKIAALNTLIDVAEEQLKINIRKKPGAKQS